MSIYDDKEEDADDKSAGFTKDDGFLDKLSVQLAPKQGLCSMELVTKLSYNVYQC
jgi:hypothetical protein